MRMKGVQQSRNWKEINEDERYTAEEELGGDK